MHEDANNIDPAIERYCRYQERCHSEVRNKLYQLGKRTAEVDEQVAALISHGLLNEERFAIAYAGGKWRMMRWGRGKIRSGLKQKGVSDYCITKAMKEIPDDEYEKVVFDLIAKKTAELRSEKNILAKKGKVLRFLLQKGYEQPVVYRSIDEYFRERK